jgi:hypothetical protein
MTFPFEREGEDVCIALPLRCITKYQLNRVEEWLGMFKMHYQRQLCQLKVTV